MTKSRLWSLWDLMQPFRPEQFLMLGLFLTRVEQSTQLEQAFRSDPDRKNQLQAFDRAIFDVLAEFGTQLADELELPAAARVVGHVRKFLKENQDKYIDPHQFNALVDECKRHFQWDVEQRLYMSIPKDKAKYYGNASILGESAQKAFPTTYEELVLAGACYAADCNTASVFHSMRAAEKGLHAHATMLGVSFHYPIELAEWQNVIEGIDTKIIAMRALPKGQQKSEDTTFHSKAAVQYWYFKDAWRNHVAHSRDEYDEHQALTIMIHVADFIEQLATRVSE